MAAVTVSVSPERKVVYQCKAWPLNRFCSNYSPDDEIGGSQGWTYVAPCSTDVSIAPTSSPSFDALAEVAGGCPEDYDDSDTDYETGDQVAFVTSDSPSRKIVFECKTYPNSGYCNQAQFGPGTEYSNMGWDVKGYCDGTKVPTASPTPYTGSCTYLKEETTTENCLCSEADCPNPGNLPETSQLCEKTTTTSTSEPVNVYSSSTTYAAGDVVRLGVDRFKCKPWPYYLWCSNDGYKPTADSEGMWGEAWTTDGVCS
jgi:hypothetical protein